MISFDAAHQAVHYPPDRRLRIKLKPSVVGVVVVLAAVWTAKDDARYISPLAALPGYRHTIGIARSWHFLNVYGFIITGLIFVSLLFGTTQWQRLVPTSGTVFVQAWSTFVHYANFHFPPEPNGCYGYNALQQLTYFGMVFLMGPLSIATGLAMSPALVNHFSRFGGRQTARSVHFVAMLGYVVFIVVHVTLVALTGFMRNMNHISLPLLLATFNRVAPQQRYRIDEVSPHFWPNGKMPGRDDWRRLAADHFRDYRLQVRGLVENPVELSLLELRALGMEEFVTMHHCIQGWTGIAQWKGVPMHKLIDLVKPTPAARTGRLLLVWRRTVRRRLLRCQTSERRHLIRSTVDTRAADGPARRWHRPAA